MHLMGGGDLGSPPKEPCMHMLDLSRPKLYTYYKFLEAYKALCTTVRASPVVEENSNPKTSYWGETKHVLGFLRSSLRQNEKINPQLEKLRIGEERCLLYLRGERL